MSDLLWDLPDNWSWITFQEAAEIAANLVPTSTVQNLPHIAPDNIRGGDGMLLEFRTVAEDEVKSPKHRFYPGQILYSKIRPYLRKAVIVDFDGVCSADMYPLTPREDIDARYLYYWMFSPQLAGFVLAHEGRTVLPKVNQAGLNQTPFPRPPAAEQRRIVAKLDSLRARSSRARNELDHIPKLIERYKQAILRAALKGELTADWRTTNKTEPVKSLLKRMPSPEQPRGGREATDSVTPGMAGLSVNHPQTDAPEGWQWMPLLRLARQETGHTPSRSQSHYWNGGIPWIGIKDANIHHGRTITETLQTVSEEGLANSSARLLPEGTVCLSRTASVGYVTIMGRSMATSQDFATWTCTAALLPKFLMYALMAEGDDIRRFGEGSTHTTIYFPEIRALHICLAPIDEQAEIVRRVEHALAWVDKIAREYTRADHLLPKLDQAILAKAFRGELVPQDPDDEPASVLLERIKTERDGIEAPTRRRARSA